MSKHVFLIGFMGSGKTHWGRKAAVALSRPFLDLDARIEAREGKSIARIFGENGEAGFRELEKQCLRDLKGLPPSIIATGGGTPCFFDNMAWMRAHGHVVYLKTPPEILFERLKPEREQRPLLKSLDDAGLSDFIRQRLAARAPAYERADCIIERTDDGGLFLTQLLDLIRTFG